MIAKSPDQQQRNLFSPLLSEFIDMGHEQVLLSKKKLTGNTLSPIYQSIIPTLGRRRCQSV